VKADRLRPEPATRDEVRLLLSDVEASYLCSAVHFAFRRGMDTHVVGSGRGLDEEVLDALRTPESPVRAFAALPQVSPTEERRHGDTMQGRHDSFRTDCELIELREGESPHEAPPNWVARGGLATLARASHTAPAVTPVTGVAISW
jgi:hypothetical protein